MTDTTQDGSAASVGRLHADLRQLGFSIAEGELAEQSFGASTTAALGQFQASRGLPVSGTLTAETAQELATATGSIVINPGPLPFPHPIPQPPPDDPPVTYTVTGVLTLAGSAAVANHTVQLVDKNVGGDTVLAAARTDATGHYTVQAGIAHGYLTGHSKAAPDLQVRLLQGDQVVATSIVRYAATTSEQLDLTLTAGQLQLPSEYEALTAAIAAVYDGPLAALQENGQQQDISYLANRTGWDARAIAMAVQAAQLAEPTTPTGGQVQTPPAPFYYALLRAGLPADRDQLHATNPAAVKQLWSQAISTNLLPNALSDSIDSAIGSYRGIAAGVALSAPPAVGSANLGGLLGAQLGQNVDQQRAFATLLADHRDDPTTLWAESTKLLGPELTATLQLDGQLAYLTVNNAALRDALNGTINAPVDLVTAGYHEATAWQRLLSTIDAPPEFTGPPDQAKAAYAQALAAHVRLAFPTATVGQLVSAAGLGVQDASRQAVTSFLTGNQAGFDIGAEPITQYLARTGLEVAPAVVGEVSRLQRLYQVTPNMPTLAALASAGIDSAYAIAQIPVDRFVARFAPTIGADAAALTHSRALAVHGTTLQVALAYLAGRQAPTLGATAAANMVSTTTGLGGKLPSAALHAEATLQDLFGDLDYCACDDCRSIISPAAYLVDLLDYLDNDAPSAGFSNPLRVLLGRRPDIGALPLTCDNTNIALPYIDLVNEILEFYVGNADSLTGYPGHTLDGTLNSAELIAAPQNDNDPAAASAYQTLERKVFPPPLPFNRDLEQLRAHLASLGTTLYQVLRELRPRDSLDRAPADDPSVYGWREVLTERLNLSRAQLRLLTDSTITIQDLYGYPAGTDVAAQVSSLQEFSRRTGVGYDDIVAILQTRTVNPECVLLPLLRELTVPVAVLQQLHAGTLDAGGLAALLPAGIDPSRYGGAQPTDIAAWVLANYDALMRLIVIDVTGSPSDTTAMRLAHLDPDPGQQPLTELDLYRLIRFIRLWRALGLSIPTTDELIQAFLVPTDPTTDTELERFDSAMQTVLLRAGLAYQVSDLLGLDAATDLPSLITCWGPVGTSGPDSLYARLFRSPTLLDRGGVFAPDIHGQVLPVPPADPAQTVLGQKAALGAALGLTSAEFDVLTGSAPAAAPLAGIGLGYDASTVLGIDTLSALYRRAWLARVLRISIVELLSLAELTAIDPFAVPTLESQQPVVAPLLDFVKLVQSLATAGVAPVQAAYLLWNADLSGVSAPPADAATRLAIQLRSAFAAVDAQFRAPASPTLDSARNLMALVLGSAAADRFFGLLTGSYLVTVPFAYSRQLLPATVISAAGGKVSYDDLGKQLSYTGYLDPTTSATMQAAAGADAALVAGITDLATAADAAKQAFLDQYGDPALPLAGPFEAYLGSPDPTIKGSLAALLGALLPVLAARRKQLQALGVASSAAATDPAFTAALLTNPTIMTAVADQTEPAILDLTSAGIGGLRAEFHTDGNLASPPAAPAPAAGALDYDPATNPLPPPTGGATAIAASWRGFLAADQTGTYGLQLHTNSGAVATVTIAGVDVHLTSTDGLTWTNQHPITLDTAVPSAITISVTGLTDTLHARWETTGTGWQPIPVANLYAADAISALAATLTRFLKLSALATNLGLNAADFEVLAAKAELTVAGRPWTSQLSVDGVAAPASFPAWTTVLRGLLTYVALKSKYGKTDDRFRDALLDLVGGAGTGKLSAVTGWDAASLAALTTQLFGTADLGAVAGPLPALDRLAAALGVLATCKLPAAPLIAAATNDPTQAVAQAFQSAVRSRFSESDWLTAVQAINDRIRTAQRDALVGYVLLQSGGDILTALGIAATPNRVPTADDLFSYFLVDAEMAPCMLTSRIRHALSSVQLFIERCLRNLEPSVNPNDIDGTQWVWRKRYRVWQANREVFLWPENWLDESLRDDQSPFFKATMNELLQSDITDDTAAAAYLSYLSNLEQVAKLEPCGLYLDAGRPGTDDDVVHVVARSAGSHRKHYYRRYASGAWTAWADTKLTIEDNPVVPYVWNGRLLLFWLQVHRKSNMDASSVASSAPQPQSNEPHLADAKLSEISGRVLSRASAMATEQISVVLCFSEYYNGAWQPVKTSDPNAPAAYRGVPSGSFDRSSIDLRPWRSADPNDGRLYVEVIPRMYGPVSYPAFDPAGFVLYNTHSAPLIATSDGDPVSPNNPNRSRTLPPGTAGGSTQLTASYQTFTGLWFGFPRYSDGSDVTVLTGRLPLTVRQAQNDVADQWSMPFFVSDPRNNFYVTSSVSYRWFDRFKGYGLLDAGQLLSNARTPVVPPVIVERAPVQPGAPVEITNRLGDPAEAQSALGQAATLRAVFGSAQPVSFDGVSIGAGGAVAAAGAIGAIGTRAIETRAIGTKAIGIKATELGTDKAGGQQ